MKRAVLVLLMLCASAAQAQMYKWKDEKGVTHFTATPPPASAKGATVKNYGSGSTGGDMPAELAELARNQPVVLYTAPGCAGCDQARALLAKRGIPYRERTVVTADDVAALKQAGSGNGQVPLLLVGRARQIGFEQAAWNDALSNAGYPLVKALPHGYVNPAATAAAPAPQPSAEERARARAEAEAAAAAAAAAAEKARRDRDTPNNAPPNFRF